LTVQTGKGFQPGMWIIASDSGNSANSVAGPVTAYNSATGALSFTVSAADIRGGGTPAGWTVGLGGRTGSGTSSLAV
ncbi:hypothetical protein ABLW26_23715, partial [Salmonella enterica]|uniref:hypothetical protein n=1 Tax=Salmonella enterica TaxID=28901 RepID=UPI0032B619E2